MPTSPLNVLAERLESVTELDGPARTAGRIVRGLISDGASKNVLSGAWLGHALHPIMTDVPIGVWTSAVRRSGLVHATANGTATALMISSYVARKRDRRGRGRLLSLAGSGALGAGVWLGGHLSYTLGAASRPAGHRPGRPQRKPGELPERPRGCGGRAVRARRLPASAEKGTPSRVPPRPNGTRLRKWSSRDARYSRAAARGCPQARALLSRGCLDGIGPVNTIEAMPKITRVSSHEQLLLQAIAIARDARAHGNHPFGALLADRHGQVLLTAENTVVTNRDTTGHAETNLIRKATVTYSPAELADTTLYTSTEPCAMCAGAIYWSAISTVIYALAETTLYELTGNDPENPTLTLSCRTVFRAGSRPITVLGPFDLIEAREVHDGFWHPVSDG